MNEPLSSTELAAIFCMPTERSKAMLLPPGIMEVIDDDRMRVLGFVGIVYRGGRKHFYRTDAGTVLLRTLDFALVKWKVRALDGAAEGTVQAMRDLEEQHEQAILTGSSHADNLRADLDRALEISLRVVSGVAATMTRSA